jgi:hypothetical protein
MSWRVAGLLHQRSVEFLRKDSPLGLILPPLSAVELHRLAAALEHADGEQFLSPA